MQVYAAALIIFGVSLASSAISNYFISKKVDIKTANEVSKAYSEFMKEYRRALSEGDEDKLKKLEKRQKQIQDALMKSQMERMKVSFYLLIPFLVLFYAMSFYFGATAVAVSPVKFSIFYFVANKALSAGYGMNFVTWYIISSLFTNTVMAKLFKTMP